MLKIKKILTLGIISTGILSIASCAHNNPNNPSSNTPIPDSTPSPSTDDLPSSNSSETRVPVEEISAFVESIGNNYTFEQYFYITGADEHTKILRDGDKAFDEINNIHYTLEGETLYSITQNEKGEWHKNYADKTADDIFDQKKYLAELLNNFTWISYDENTNTFTGTGDYAQNNNIEVQLQISPTELNLTSEGGYTKITNLDKTIVTLPTNIKDDTIESEKIYTIDEQGNYDFNITLLHQILDDWFKGNNQWDEDSVTYLMNTTEVSYKQIVYIDISTEKCELGIIHNDRDSLFLRPFYIKDSNFFTSLLNNTISTADEFKQYLNSVTWRAFTMDIEAVEIDASLSKEDSDLIVKNLLSDLGERGCGDTVIPNLGLENVLWYALGTLSDEIAGKRSGYLYCLLTMMNGQCEFMKLSYSARNSIYGGHYFVKIDDKDLYSINSVAEKPMNIGNLELYNS